MPEVCADRQETRELLPASVVFLFRRCTGFMRRTNSNELSLCGTKQAAEVINYTNTKNKQTKHDEKRNQAKALVEWKQSKRNLKASAGKAWMNSEEHNIHIKERKHKTKTLNLSHGLGGGRTFRRRARSGDSSRGAGRRHLGLRLCSRRSHGR